MDWLPGRCCARQRMHDSAVVAQKVIPAASISQSKYRARCALSAAPRRKLSEAWVLSASRPAASEYFFRKPPCLGRGFLEDRDDPQCGQGGHSNLKLFPEGKTRSRGPNSLLPCVLVSSRPLRLFLKDLDQPQNVLRCFGSPSADAEGHVSESRVSPEAKGHPHWTHSAGLLSRSRGAAPGKKGIVQPIRSTFIEMKTIDIYGNNSIMNCSCLMMVLSTGARKEGARGPIPEPPLTPAFHVPRLRLCQPLRRVVAFARGSFAG